MENYTLHYAPLENESDARIFDFSKKAKLLDFITINTAKKSGFAVFLCHIDSDTEICITQYLTEITNFLNQRIRSKQRVVLFLDEYPSYEDAYMVAITRREGNPLCYGLDKPIKITKRLNSVLDEDAFNGFHDTYEDMIQDEYKRLMEND